MKKYYLLTLTLLAATFLRAQLPGWTYFDAITVTENSGSDVINYQLLIEMDTETPIAAGEMAVDGSDLRFSSACTGGDLFNYWIESGINTTSTKIWVKIDTLLANQSRTIYIHHGNGSASAISAIDGTFSGPHSATDSVSGASAGGVTNSQRGFRFSPNEDILLTALGKNEPNGTTRYLTLFDFASQAILLQTQISGPAAAYTYQNSPAPMWLTAGTQYLLEIYQGAADGYYYGASGQIGQHLTYYDMRYCNGCDQNTFPTNYLNNIHYGYCDMWYYTKNNVTPAPSYAWGGFIVQLPTDAHLCETDTLQMPLSIGGGAQPMTFEWTNYAINDTTLMQPLVFTVDTAQYIVAISDACGFSSADTIVVNTTPQPVSSILGESLICEGETATLVVDGDYTFVWDDASTNDTLMVSPLVTTTYGVTVSDTLGCTLFVSHVVDINQPVYHTVDTLACFGSTYQVGSSTYTVDGIYVDTIVGITNCDSIITTELTFAADIDAEMQLVGMTLVADVGGSNYTFIDCDNGAVLQDGPESFFELPGNGSFAVIVQVGNCAKTSDCFEMLNIGLEDLTVDQFAVYPNPNKGVFTIRSLIDQSVDIVTSNGTFVKRVNLVAGVDEKIRLEGVAKGTYFVRSQNRIVKVVVD